MINLFSLPHLELPQNPDHLLHSTIVTDFEQQFAEYIGAKYAVAANSASSLIFLIFNSQNLTIKIPSILPPVVANALLNGGNRTRFVDDVDWVGSDYCLKAPIYDSAHRVDKNQFKDYNSLDVAVFSFYPTKPVGGIDGGIFASNDKKIVDLMRICIYNGVEKIGDSWSNKQTMIGWKMYMSTVQAHIAMQSLNNLELKKEKLDNVRKKYNAAFGLDNSSDHLYRINMKEDNRSVISELATSGIQCGIHYKALHLQKLFGHIVPELPKSEYVDKHTLSIPFHEHLTESEIKYVIKHTSKYIS